YESFKQGNIEESERYQQQLQPLRDTFSLGSLPAPLKKAAELAGIAVGPPKSPIAELSGEPLLKVKKMLEGYGIEVKMAKEQ
ncbi:dihydrodipicolinate synthase family protein, partial [Bacillus licheniformis]